MIVRLQRIEAGELRVGDIDWRTQAGVLWRMLHYATRCTDASVDAFLDAYAASRDHPTPEGNEGYALRRLSDALTGGSASTWDEVFHAAESRPTPEAQD